MSQSNKSRASALEATQEAINIGLEHISDHTTVSGLKDAEPWVLTGNAAEAIEMAVDHMMQYAASKARPNQQAADCLRHFADEMEIGTTYKRTALANEMRLAAKGFETQPQPVSPTAESAAQQIADECNIMTDQGYIGDIDKDRCAAIIQQAIDAAKPTQPAGKSAEDAFSFFLEQLGGEDSWAWHDYPADKTFYAGYAAGQAAQPQDGLREALTQALDRMKQVDTYRKGETRFIPQVEAAIAQTEKALATAPVAQPEKKAD